MAIDPQTIQSELNRITRGSGIDNILNLSSSLIDTQLASVTTKIGIDINQPVSGFLPLAQFVDDVVPSVPASKLTQQTGALSIAQLTQKVPGFQTDLVKQVGGSKSDLDAITGSTSSTSNGFLDVVISAPFPEAIAQAVSSVVPQASPDKLKTVLGGVQNFGEGQLANVSNSQNVLNSLVGVVGNTSQSLGNLKQGFGGQFLQSITNTLGGINKGFGGLLNNIVQKVDNPIGSAINPLLRKNNVKTVLPPEQFNNLNSLLEQQKYAEATTLLQQYSDRPASEIESTLRSIDLSLSNNLKQSASSDFSIKANRLDEGEKNWSGANTPRNYQFSFVGTHEELEVDLKSASREITSLIIHWSETFHNQDIGADEIHSYNSKVDQGIPYHYVLRRDGTIQRGRPINKEGGPLANGHERYSVQIVLVGGINAPLGTPDPKKYLSKNSFTREQFNTLDVLLEKAYSAWPGLQVMGHIDIDRSQQDPGFDVPDYVFNKFGKALLYKNPSAETPLSRAAMSTLRVTE